MLIPAAISLMLSIIFLNLSLLVNGGVLFPGKFEPSKAGQVMGAYESAGEQNIFIEQNGALDRAMVKIIEEIELRPMTNFPQLPQFDLPMQNFPKSKNKADQADAEFNLTAENGIILDCQNNNLYYAKRPDRPWPIASITKLFTVYTFLDYNPGWETVYEMKAEDKREGGKIYLFPGDKVKIIDLLYFSLVGSDNTATAALVHSTGLSEEEFVKRMNLKVKELGLVNTRLVDPVGLSDGNISTAREVAEFAKISLAIPEISRASVAKKYDFITEQGRKKSIATTNALLSSFPRDGVNILGGKTGHVNSSGYCLVSQFKNQEGKSIVTVVLGADSETSRFILTKKLVELYYSRQQ